MEKNFKKTFKMSFKNETQSCKSKLREFDLRKKKRKIEKKKRSQILFLTCVCAFLKKKKSNAFFLHICMLFCNRTERVPYSLDCRIVSASTQYVFINKTGLKLSLRIVRTFSGFFLHFF